MNLCVLALEKVPIEHVAVINRGAVDSHKLIVGDSEPSRDLDHLVCFLYSCFLLPQSDGNNVKRFLLGRQFCVVWMDFAIFHIGSFYSMGITVILSQVCPSYFLCC